MRSARGRVAVYLLFAFGIASVAGGVIHATGGIFDSPTLIPGTPVTVALALIGSAYMFSPAIANVLTRLVTREGFGDLRLRPRFGDTWRYWLAAWLVPLAAIAVGAAAYFALFPGNFDQTEPWARFAAQAIPTVLVAPLLLSLLTFGEEFGWRGYLQPKLLLLTSPRKAMVYVGVIWGAWHWPLIAMGYQYGFGYPGFPWLGMAVFLWFTFSAGTILGWLAFRGRSVWPAVLGHATINGTAALPAVLVAGSPSPLIGPLPIGLVGGLGFAAVALWVLARWGNEKIPAGQRGGIASHGAAGRSRARIG